jgi:AcrR family transcriptional regulator
MSTTASPGPGPGEVDNSGGIAAFQRIFAERVVRRDSGRELPAGPKARRTRGLILDAARAEFRERGYQRTTMNDVSARAGVSQGTVYQYFRDRSDLVVAIIQEGLRLLLTRTDARWRPGEGTPGLERILTNYAVGFAEAPDVVRVWEEVSHIDEEMADLRRSLRHLFEDSIEHSLRDGQRAGLIAEHLDPGETTRALCAMADRYCYVTYVFDTPPGGPPAPDDTGRLLAAIWSAALGLT